MASLDNILVVGGTGFIGSSIIEEALLRGFSCTSLSRSAPPDCQTLEGVEYLQADLCDRGSLEFLKERDFTYIVFAGGAVDHSALSTGGKSVIDTHLGGLINFTENINKTNLKRFIFFGSGDEYGTHSEVRNEADREAPFSPYSFSKVACTHFLQMLHRTEGLSCVILRLFLAYGEKQKSNRVIPYIIQKSKSNAAIELGDGDNIRDFCHISDIVRAVFLVIASEGIDGEIINIASGEPRKINEVAEFIVGMIGKGKLEFSKSSQNRVMASHQVADTKKANEMLEWYPEKKFEQGLTAVCCYKGTQEN